jgi:hypothetical protein
LGVGPGVQAGGRKENGQQGQAEGSDERAVHDQSITRVFGRDYLFSFFGSRHGGTLTVGRREG